MEQIDKSKQKTIMVIDDDESVLSFLNFSLGAEGFHMLSARDAEGAQTLLQKQVPHLILLDIMLPKMNGFALCKKLRTQTATQKVPIIFITAYADPNSLKMAKEVGAQGLIEKPILFDELLLQVFDGLEGRISLPTRLKFAQ